MKTNEDLMMVSEGRREESVQSSRMEDSYPILPHKGNLKKIMGGGNERRLIDLFYTRNYRYLISISEFIT